MATVAEAVADGRFKPNCNLVIVDNNNSTTQQQQLTTQQRQVIVDFLVRHGYLQPEDPGYVPLVHSLRRLPSD